MAKSEYSPTLLLFTALARHGADLIYEAGRLSISSNLLSPSHDEYILRDIRKILRELGADLAAFDRAEPELATLSQRLLDEQDARLNKRNEEAA